MIGIFKYFQAQNETNSTYLLFYIDADLINFLYHVIKLSWIRCEH